MEHNVSDKNLKEIISELLRLGYEELIGILKKIILIVEKIN